jgi:hypothetical protein
MPTYTFSEDEAGALRSLCDQYVNTMRSRTGHTENYRNVQGALDKLNAKHEPMTGEQSIGWQSLINRPPGKR